MAFRPPSSSNPAFLRDPFAVDDGPSLPTRPRRTEGRGGAARGRVRGNLGRSLPETASAEEDNAVRATNDDAATSKLSAIRLGYWSDPFLQHFVSSGPRRPPIINRGYYLRNRCIFGSIEKFLGEQQGRRKQVVVLGAGYDTSYFRLREKGYSNFAWFEIDHEEVAHRKSNVIRANASLLKHTGESIDSGNGGDEEFHSQSFHLVSSDLRKFLSETQARLIRYGFDKKADTLVVSECVLIYLDAERADDIIEWFGRECESAVMITYEQILPHDAFGKMMLQNLESRNIFLRGIHAYPTIDEQKKRYLQRGFSRAEAKDTWSLWRDILPKEEKERIGLVEMMDELEEWDLISKHYMISVAIKENLDGSNAWLGQLCTLVTQEMMPETETEDAD